MPLGLLGLAGLLVQAAPMVAGLFDNDSTAGKTLDMVGKVGKAITGHADENDAVAALRADPGLMLEFVKTCKDEAIAIAQEETKRLETVNATIRKEIDSDDRYVRRWRPTFGYAVALTWVMTMGAIAWAIIWAPAQAPAIIAALVNTSPIWGIALGVLGVSVIKRSTDKQTAAGEVGKAVAQNQSLVQMVKNAKDGLMPKPG